jgi:hypothetical protein
MKIEIEEERANQICKNLLENENIVLSNYKLWSSDLDDWLKDWVIIFNFNFSKIAERFQDTISYPLKYDYTEDQIRKHWAFIHAARSLEIPIDYSYYDDLKKSKDVFNDKEKLREEEKIKELEKEIESEKFIGKDSVIVPNKIIAVEEEVNTMMPKETSQEKLNTIKPEIEITDKISSTNEECPVKDSLSDNVLEETKTELKFDEEDETINALFKKKEKVDTNLAKEVESIKNKLKENDEANFPINPTEKSETLHFTQMEHDLMNTCDLDDYVSHNDNLKEEYDRLSKFQDFTLKSLNYLMPRMGQAPAEEPNLEDMNDNIKLEDTKNKLKDFMKTVIF